MSTMKEEIEQTLKVLVGMPMWGSHRAADVQGFMLGKRVESVKRNGRIITVGEYGLHIQCSWRLIRAATIAVASGDRYFAAGDDPFKDYDTFDWDEQPNRRDERIDALFAAWADRPLVVESVESDIVGSLHISLTQQCALDVFPSDSLGREHWRLLPNSPKRDHFVVTGRGIEA